MGSSYNIAMPLNFPGFSTLSRQAADSGIPGRFDPFGPGCGPGAGKSPVAVECILSGRRAQPGPNTAGESVVPAQSGKDPNLFADGAAGLSVVIVAAGLIFCERLGDRMLFEKRQ